MSDSPAADAWDAHLDRVIAVSTEALAHAGADALLVDAGSAQGYFLDDSHAPWRANPHFAWWMPFLRSERAAIVFRPGHRPVLQWIAARDYWHAPPRPPEGAWTARFDIRAHPDAEALRHDVTDTLRGATTIACISADPDYGANLGRVRHNPHAVLDHIHFHRACKSAFELAAMRRATARAVAGHRAAHAAFADGGSELDLHVAFLAGSRQRETDLPYPSIVALNEHGAVLHYQHCDDRRPPEHRAFLLDAGATDHGYAADVTRTWAARPGEFADLVARVDAMQQRIVAAIRPGLSFVDLHEHAHRELADVLIDAGLARGDPDGLVDQGVTRAFLPHGLGHLLGLQTHDAGGHLADASGTPRPPPARDPALRFTRALQPDCVVTIEPGLYFIPMLLDELRGGRAAASVDWDRVDALTPYGGIRIEDNVRVTATGVENLTRDAFADIAGMARMAATAGLAP